MTLKYFFPVLLALSGIAHADSFYVTTPRQLSTGAIPPVNEELSLSLSGLSLPDARVGAPYSFDYVPLLKVAGDPSFTLNQVVWSTGALPPGLTLSTGGLLSGVPLVRNKSSTVVLSAAYGGVSATQVYELAIKAHELKVMGSMDFGEVDVGQRTPTLITLKNTGDFDYAPGAPSLGEDANPSFQLGATDCVRVLNPDASCTLTVYFQPSAPGAGAASISFPDASQPIQSVPLKGFGRVLDVKLESGEVPSVSVNSAMEFPVTLRNDGNTAVTVDPVTLNSVVGEGYSFVESSCPAKLGPGATCTVLLQFNPQMVGLHAGSFSIKTQAGVKSISLSGQGVVSDLAMLPFTTNLGAAQLGSSTISETVTLKNSGGAPAEGVSVATSDAKFSITQSTCGASIAANSSCSFKVSYAPTEVGVRRATLVVNSAQFKATMPISATGREVSAALQIPKTNIQAWYLSAMEFQLDLYNYGSGPLQVTGVDLASPRPEYTRVPAKDTCTSSLAPGASCKFTYRFDGLTPGAVTPVAFIADTDAGFIKSAEMPASVLRTKIFFSVAEVDFGKVLVGETALSAPVRVSNTGNSGSVTYKLPAGVTVAESSCPASGTNFPLSSACSMRFQYRPTAAGILAKDGLWTWMQGKDGNQLPFKGEAVEATIPFASATDFGWVDVGYPEVAFAVVNNVGSNSIDISQKSLTGDASLSLDASGTCGNTLAAKSTCTQGIKFSPTVRGPVTGSLKVGSLAPATVSAKGAVAQLSFSAPTLTFGERQVDTADSNRPNIRTTLLNSGDPTKRLNRGTVPLGFSSAGCTSNLTEANPSCDLIISAFPERLKDSIGKLHSAQMEFSAGNSAPVKVTFSIIPVLPRATMSEPTFVTTAAGSTSNAKLTITNTGVYRIQFEPPVISGNTAEFFYSSAHSTCGSTLAYRDSCTMAVDFMPSEAGPRTEGQFSVSLGNGVVLTAPLNGVGK